MKTNLSITQWLTVLAFSIISLQPTTTFAQGTTAFTYQGQLHDGGTNANGAYTMIFALYDAVSGGNQIGSTITTPATLANGLFSVNLDFGAGAFNGSARWLDITVQSGSDNEELTPRVQVLPAPYAQFAAVAASVTNGAITASAIANGAVGSAQLATNLTVSGTLEVSNNLQIGGTLWDVNIGDVMSSPGKSVTNGLVFSYNGLPCLELGAINGNIDGWAPSAVIAREFDCRQIYVRDSSLNTVANIDSSGNIIANGNISAGSFTGASVPNWIQEFTPAGTYPFEVPPGISRLLVEAWGGGGGGGAGNPPYAGGGGGGGAYSRGIINVTAGTALTIKVGAGGAGGYYTGLPSQTGYGGDGGDSSIASTNGTVLIVSGGGKGGGLAVPGYGGVGGTPDPNAAIGRYGSNGGNSGTAGYYPPGGYSTFCPLKASVFSQYTSSFYDPNYGVIFTTQGAGTGGAGGINPGESQSGQDGYILIQW